MSQTIKEVLIQATQMLFESNISEPELSARFLLQHVTGLNHINFQLSLNEHMTQEQIEAYHLLIEKRLTHMPVQYLIGYVDFYNVKLKVDQRALIPRPETEALVERLLEVVGDRKNFKIIDIGTGSGNIAIALAFNLKQPGIIALDISEQALALARENAELNEVDEYIKFACDDVFNDEFWQSNGPFDLIVSNPPYINSSEYESLQPEIRQYEPEIALISKGDVLAYYREICKRAADSLNPEGILCFEIGIGQDDEISEIIKSTIPGISVKMFRDLCGIPRIFIALR